MLFRSLEPPDNVEVTNNIVEEEADQYPRHVIDMWNARYAEVEGTLETSSYISCGGSTG